MAAFEGSTLNISSRADISKKKQKKLEFDLQQCIAAVSSLIRANPNELSTEEPLNIDNKYLAAIEYGRILKQLSNLLVECTLFSLQSKLILDYYYLMGNANVPFNTISNSDNVLMNDRIAQISMQLGNLEKWVGM
jgi:hypothetical protein